MVVPILRFHHGIVGFDKLANPAAYYVVITDNIDGRIRLVLGHQADDVATQYPKCLLYTKADMEAKCPIIVFTDTGVRIALIDHITGTLRKKYSPLIGPNTTVTQRNDGGGAHGTGSTATREAQLRAQKAFIPLRRAVQNDREKLAKITYAANELKLTYADNHSEGAHCDAGISHVKGRTLSSAPTHTPAYRCPDLIHGHGVNPSKVYVQERGPSHTQV
jgi:hypothetical protein